MPGLPFPPQLRIPVDDLSGRIEVILKALPEEGMMLEEEDYAGALSLLNLFAQGINAQLFRGQTDQPAKLAVERIEWSARDTCCEMVARAEHVPAYAWFHLLAMLQKNHEALEMLESVSISATGNHTPLSWEQLRSSVPQVFSTVPPPFVFEETGGVDKSKNLTIELEFEYDLNDDIVGAVTDDFMTWMQFVILGAFDGDLGPADDLDPPGRVERISSIRMECFLPYFHSDMSGFAALENLLRNIHRRFPLAEVEIQ